jgi:hypothetical protein
MTIRAVCASVFGLLAAVCMRSWGGGQLPSALWIPTALLGAAALLCHHRHVGSQLLCRAAFWSNLLLGLLATIIGSSSERPVGVALMVTTGAALLLLGRRGLDGDVRAGSFRPLAFRTTLLAIMVMALADAQSLFLFGTLELEGWHSDGRTVLLFGLAGLLVLGLVGLYRLRGWGLVVGAAGCLALAGAALGDALGLPQALNVAFVATSLAQLAIVAPLAVAVWRGARA